MVLAATFIASLLLVAAAKPMGPRAMVVHENRAEPARGFVKSGVASPARELTLRIALRPNNIAGLETALYAVSDPASSLYGQHLTPAEVRLALLSSIILLLDLFPGRAFHQAHGRDALSRQRVAHGERHLIHARHPGGRHARNRHPRRES